MTEHINAAGFNYKNDYMQTTTLGRTKIKNGSKLICGGELSRAEIVLHKHFNWFQKLMWKFCFGVDVQDYSEE